LSAKLLNLFTAKEKSFFLLVLLGVGDFCLIEKRWSGEIFNVRLGDFGEFKESELS
jgi:hypothetical protein